jgi:hypothetical protein
MGVKKKEVKGDVTASKLNRRIVPSPEIESKLARAVEKGFARKPKAEK